MPVEMKVWRMDGDRPHALSTAVLPSEAALEDFIEQDPTLLGTRLLVIGRQVRTPHGKYIDLLAMDVDGNLHVLELKRDKTPRDVVAQALDYGAWVSTLTRDQVSELAGEHLDQPLEAAFEEVFGSAPPDELNGELEMTVVATDLDPGSERIVTYLREFGVPVNAVLFSYFEDEGRRYLARSWVASPEESRGSKPAGGKPGKRAEWNGRDWFVSFGDDETRSWQDGAKYGFVSAGGGAWFTNTLRSLPIGARVNVCIPSRGYVAIGETLAAASPFDEAQVHLDDAWVRLDDQSLVGRYHHGVPGEAEPGDLAEYVVPVKWSACVSKSEAFWEKGMFANQNSACKLRQEFTLERLASHFGVESD